MTTTGPIAPPRRPEPAPATRTPVTVLAGLHSHATADVADRLLHTEPGLILIAHDLADLADGHVRRRVRDATGVLEEGEAALAHGCVSCAVRDDLVPLLVRLAHDHPGRPLLVELPETVEPQDLAEACAHAPAAEVLRVDSCTTVLDALSLLGDLNSVDDLAHRRRTPVEDTRGVAEVLVRQIEYADTVLLRGEASGGPYETARLGVLTRRLAPWAAHPSPPDDEGLAAAILRTGRYDPGRPPGPARALAGLTLGVHEPFEDCGVISMLFATRRPFHAGRLHARLDEIAYPALRARGHLWLATQPDTVVAFEAAGGGIAMASLGPWLDALPVSGWDAHSAGRRVAAALDWDPYYGDRGTSLAFIGEGFDVDELRLRLEGCLLTDMELSQGRDAWTAGEDPFAGCFPSAA
ncbi:CobW family GTP-binding protein [Phytomonospora endophytica]|uniref:G3E family GTPase n=1 Tax=Phytomonospora endophytica TaxID=714109 RepID=A0A841FLZ5_9ACTN|nr:GTP-binding protein [Phytomonospora endophytica]MBB6033629.1 G3E family GTPase [Phytomonospora endophytica]GIG64855.1 cobalamin biosynthesis protein CobW [Phytomonospora endophytica]